MSQFILNYLCIFYIKISHFYQYSFVNPIPLHFWEHSATSLMVKTCCLQIYLELKISQQATDSDLRLSCFLIGVKTKHFFNVKKYFLFIIIVLCLDFPEILNSIRAEEIFSYTKILRKMLERKWHMKVLLVNSNSSCFTCYWEWMYHIYSRTPNPEVLWATMCLVCGKFSLSFSRILSIPQYSSISSSWGDDQLTHSIQRRESEAFYFLCILKHPELLPSSWGWPPSPFGCLPFCYALHGFSFCLVE